MEDKPKKPWYRKWWGVTPIVVGLLAVLGFFIPEPVETPDTAQFQETQVEKVQQEAPKEDTAKKETKKKTKPTGQTQGVQTQQTQNKPSPKPTTPPRSSGVVKKSSTGICHAPGTTYYDRTKNFTSYNVTSLFEFRW